MDKTSIGDRMKSYEDVTDYSIINRVPLVARLDGNNFSKFTKQMKYKKPFDTDFSTAMIDTAKHLISKVQGCVVAYTQSDEISLIIRTDQSLNTTPWLGNRIQKMTSILASMATYAFNLTTKQPELPAYFDCRVHQVPTLVEVENYLIWRQRDCTKNSISSAAYYEIGNKCGRKTAQKILHELGQNERQEALFQHTEINWNDYDPMFKRGIVIYKEQVTKETELGECIRTIIKHEAPPIFTSDEGRKWLSERVSYEQEAKQ